jgi:hypothetical protein
LQCTRPYVSISTNYLVTNVLPQILPWFRWLKSVLNIIQIILRNPNGASPYVNTLILNVASNSRVIGRSTYAPLWEQYKSTNPSWLW